MKRHGPALLGVILLLACIVILTVYGQTYTLKVPVPEGASDASAYTVRIDPDGDTVRLTDRQLRDGILELTFRSGARGKAFVEVTGPGGFDFLDALYSHPLGAITRGSYVGDCRGGVCVPAALILFLLAALWDRVSTYRRDMKKSMYQYRNIRNLGLIILLCSFLLGQLRPLFRFTGIGDAVRSILSSFSYFSVLILPVAFLVSVLVILSNVQLMRKEGKTWRNMLGIILAALVCLGTLFPVVMGEILQRSTLVDVHNERGLATYLDMFAEKSILMIVSYLETVLLATILLTVKAARHVPAFDRDYMIIHGCQIRKDGTLTNLLKGRADRALEFAAMQKERTGRDLTFVPSGGQGPDEAASEAAAIRNYLLSAGVPAERILTEDRSATTEENMRFSRALMEKDAGGRVERVGFATTNYHVFRTGVLAAQEGMEDAEGIGSPTRTYFWINAFIREFAATLYAERKKHLRVILLLLLLSLVYCVAYYLVAVT